MASKVKHGAPAAKKTGSKSKSIEDVSLDELLAMEDDEIPSRPVSAGASTVSAAAPASAAGEKSKKRKRKAAAAAAASATVAHRDEVDDEEEDDIPAPVPVAPKKGGAQASSIKSAATFTADKSKASQKAAMDDEIAEHKAQLEALKASDPEFYEHLLKSDKALLDFGGDQDDDEDLETDEAEWNEAEAELDAAEDEDSGASDAKVCSGAQGRGLLGGNAGVGTLMCTHRCDSGFKVPQGCFFVVLYK
jgi:hypothetical protein